MVRLNITIYLETAREMMYHLYSTIEAFVQQHHHQSVMIFMDGAVNGAGRGSSATVLIPLAAGDQEVETTQVHSILTCSLETEIAAIALAMEQAVDCYSSVPEEN